MDTLTGKETLHDTVGIIYQNVDNILDSEMNKDNAIDNAHTENVSTTKPPQKRKRSLKEISPDIISYSKRLKMLGRLAPVQIDQPLPVNISCLETIDILYLLSHAFRVPNTPSWTGFNSRIIEDNIPKQRVSYLSPINLSPTNASVVAHTMEQAQNVGIECGQTYVQVTYDLAIAKIAYKIQATEGRKFSNLFIHLGSFHLMMAYFKTIGHFIDECGLTHMMIESKIIASGSVNGIIEGKHFNRCKRLHPLMALSLQLLHFDQFLKNKDDDYEFVKGQIYEDLLDYQKTKISLQSSTK